MIKGAPNKDVYNVLVSFHVNSTRGHQVTLSDFAETWYICSK